jgi:DNA modification methylase
MLAAEKLGLRGVGIDVDAGYLKVAEGRIEKLRQGIDTTGVGVV